MNNCRNLVDFPWGELPPGTTVCDVGGGIGSLTIELAKQYSHLQLKLQDLPDCIAQAKNEIWPKECPQAIEENRVEFKSLDFLTESPIKGCDVYFVSLTYFVKQIAAKSLSYLPDYS